MFIIFSLFWEYFFAIFQQKEKIFTKWMLKINNNNNKI